MGQKGDNNMNPEDGFVGVDVSKAYLDIAVRPAGDGWRVTNDDSGVAQAVDQLSGRHDGRASSATRHTRRPFRRARFRGGGCNLRVCGRTALMARHQDRCNPRGTRADLRQAPDAWQESPED